MNIYALKHDGAITLVFNDTRPTKEQAAVMLQTTSDVQISTEPVTELTNELMADATVNKAYRVLKAHKALSHYEDDVECNITDLLTDLRHLADAYDLDFSQLDDEAYSHYTEEKNEE